MHLAVLGNSVECRKGDQEAWNLVLDREIRKKMQIICQSEKYIVFQHNFHDTRQQLRGLD